MPKPKSFRFSDETYQRLNDLAILEAQKQIDKGKTPKVSQTSIIEQAVAELHKKKIKV